MRRTLLFLFLLLLFGTSGRAEDAAGMEDTYWRDEATGDWLIGFTRHGVIYDCKVWEVRRQRCRKDKYELTLFDAATQTTRTVRVGRMKEGRRKITVSGKPTAVCSPVTTPTLPYYPAKDTLSTVSDNGYRAGDSVTLRGWLKDMPPEEWSKGTHFELSFDSNIITDEPEDFIVKMDSLGRFTLKVPLLNSSQAFIDWPRTNRQVYLEPGETYYFLYDFRTGQRLFMGSNCRVQNELLGHRFMWSSLKASKERKAGRDAMTFLALTDSVKRSHLRVLEEELALHPTLSERYARYLRGYYQAQQAFTALQGRFYFRPLPDEYLDYADREFWPHLSRPFTLHRDYRTFFRDYMRVEVEKKEGKESYFDAIFLLDKKGYIALSEADKQLIRQYQEKLKHMIAAVEATPDEAERIAMVDSFNEGPIGKGFETLREKYQLHDVGAFLTWMIEDEVFDALSCPAPLRDMLHTARLFERVESFRLPLDSLQIAVVDREVRLPAVKQYVWDLHEKFLKLRQQELVHAASLRSPADVEGMTDGEQIFRKLVEPYKGRVVYLDIWGSWCGPCMKNIARSHETKEALKDFDVVYLYLASSTGDDAWKSVIKEYGLTGENIVHYNLPAAQQAEVEKFLKLTGYPTYRLVDKQGKIHDLHWLHMEQMDDFVKQVEALSR